MSPFAESLSGLFERSGWERAQIHVEDLGWWADEIWELRSVWSPVGARAFIAFLVDPMWDGVRLKGQGVWAAGHSLVFPRSRTEAESGGTLRVRASANEMGAFIDAINASRVQVPVDGAV
jgi:hypothetical protein